MLYCVLGLEHRFLLLPSLMNEPSLDNVISLAILFLELAAASMILCSGTDSRSEVLRRRNGCRGVRGDVVFGEVAVEAESGVIEGEAGFELLETGKDWSLVVELIVGS